VKWLPGNPGHDFSEKGVIAVAVGPFGAGWEVEFLLMRHKRNHLIGIKIIPSCETGELYHLPVIPKAAGMVQQVADLDRVPQVGQLRQVKPYVVLETEFTLLFKQEYGRGRELLGCGCQVEYGRWFYWDTVFQIGQAVALLENRTPGVEDEDRDTG